MRVLFCSCAVDCCFVSRGIEQRWPLLLLEDDQLTKGGQFRRFLSLGSELEPQQSVTERAVGFPRLDLEFFRVSFLNNSPQASIIAQLRQIRSPSTLFFSVCTQFLNLIRVRRKNFAVFLHSQQPLKYITYSTVDW